MLFRRKAEPKFQCGSFINLISRNVEELRRNIAPECLTPQNTRSLDTIQGILEGLYERLR